nr:cystathionine beta-lyase, chloroplastic isoform X2 [Ipomoea batatas]
MFVFATVEYPQPSATEYGPYDYTRSGNPTRDALEKCVASHICILQLMQKIAEMAHAHGALVLVDNSIMSHVLCCPLELGADIVMTSATKFISGHSDLMAGILAC